MSGQRVHAGEQVVLTGSAFHIPRKQIIEALWVILPRHSRYPQIVKYLAIRAALATFARKAGQAGMFPCKSRGSLARRACLAQISRTTTRGGSRRGSTWWSARTYPSQEHGCETSELYLASI
jgi:hypothetical protein